ncbi:MAG: phosphoribosylanthranilate isomerase [Vicinamibacterales bacterium]
MTLASAPGSGRFYRPRVKICGLTRAEDAVLAAALGADALGFIFWTGSPRCADVDEVQAIVRRLPPFVATVGVFVNERPARVLEIASTLGLTAVQFHGDEDDDEVAAFPWRTLRAVNPDAGEGAARLARLPSHVTVLLDAHDPVKRGGTGRAIDWSGAARIASTRPIVLAGGLRPENVAEAVYGVRPWGVDVSSGVEARPGVKDAGRLREFFDAVQRAVETIATPAAQ